jgi:hypothetical protein
MPLTSIVAVLVRILALCFISEAVKSIFLVSAVYFSADRAMTTGVFPRLYIYLGVYVLVSVAVPLALWYGAGWIANHLVNRRDSEIQVGSLSRNDLLQIAIITLGGSVVVAWLPSFLSYLFAWFSHRPFAGNSFTYILSNLALGCALVFGNRVLIRLVPPAP